MPRLDNSDLINLEVVKEWNDEWVEVVFDPDDPGATSPLDVCYFCWLEIFSDHDAGQIEHPNYEEVDSPYRCVCCGDILTEDDNDPD